MVVQVEKVFRQRGHPTDEQMCRDADRQSQEQPVYFGDTDADFAKNF